MSELFQSTAPAAQDALVTLINGIAALSALGWTGGLGPTFGQILPGPKEWMVDDDIKWASRSAPSTGSREEVYTLKVWLHDLITAATPSDVRDSMFAAAGLIEDALGHDPTLGGVVMSAFSLGTPEYGGSRDENDGTAYEGTMRLEIVCRAALTQ